MKRGVDIGAFTLIELLCVVAIVALLAGLLMPVIGRVREAGRESACAGNLRQIGQAINSYAVDSKDLLPVCERLGGLYGLPPLKDVLKPYLAGSAEVFKCPSDLLRAAPVFKSDGTSYEWNSFASGLKIDRGDFKVAGLNVVAPLLGDAEAVHRARREYLYSDGHVADSLDVLINNSKETITP